MFQRVFVLGHLGGFASLHGIVLYYIVLICFDCREEGEEKKKKKKKKAMLTFLNSD